ncbi:MAG TPA: hypothetical protein VE987_21960 [Polyangiaceae bacterium]|nr:hypothetical protein [Polyangiaceae bacterium]
MITDEKKKPYDTDEARGILAKAYAQLSPRGRHEAKEARIKAADVLLDELVTLLTNVGFRVKERDETDHCRKVSIDSGGAVYLGNDEGNIKVSGVGQFNGRTLGWKTAELDFDFVTRQFEGHEEDKRIPKRNALAVVAELIEACLREGQGQ